MQRLARPLWACQDALFDGDFIKWIKANWAIYNELCPFMNEEEQTKALTRMRTDKGFKMRGFEDNLQEFSLTTQYLRRIAHKNKLLLREEEDTSKHGG